MNPLQFYDYEASYNHYVQMLLDVGATNDNETADKTKLVLLLSIIDGIDDGVFDENRFQLNDWLEQRYETLMQQFTSCSIINDETTINIPFWHLESDNFWYLHYFGEQEPKSFLPSSVWLKERECYASIDEDLWILLQNKVMRKRICDKIVDKVLTVEEGTNTAISESSKDKANNDSSVSAYSIEIEQNRVIQPNRELTVQRLDKVFSNTATTYKYFWFISILQMLKNNRNHRMDVNDITLRMIANAWYPILHYGFYFGKIDSLHNIILDLQNITKLPNEVGVDTICDTIKWREGDINILRSLNLLSKYVPYRFLRPWIKTDVNAEVARRSKLWENNCLYSIHTEDKDLYIVINSSWDEYLNNHLDSLLDFSYRELVSYLQRQNPNAHITQDCLAYNNEKRSWEDSSNYIEDEAKQSVQRPSTTLSPKPIGLTIINNNNRCSIVSPNGKELYTSSGAAKEINGNLFRLYYTWNYLSINIIERKEGKGYVTGKRIVNIHHRTSLYYVFDGKNYLDKIEDIGIDDNGDYFIKVENLWYNSEGKRVETNVKSIPVNYSNEIESPQKTEHPSIAAEELPHKRDIEVANVKKCDNSLGIIGKTIRLLPSQIVGEVVRTRVDQHGEKKLIVRTRKGDEIESYYNEYTYEILNSREAPRSQEKKIQKNQTNPQEKTRTPQKIMQFEIEQMITASKGVQKIKVGDMIVRKSDGARCRIIGFEKIGPWFMLKIELEDGSMDWILNDERLFRVLR